MTSTPYGCDKCGAALTFAEAPNHHHACMGAQCSRCEAWFNDEHDRGVCDECRAEIGPQTDHHLDSPSTATYFRADQ